MTIGTFKTTGRVYGYARVSTNQQSLDIQIDFLMTQGVEKRCRVFTDKATGANNDRAGLDRLLQALEPGDVILVKSLDRLGRDTVEMLDLIKQFDDMNVTVHFLSEGLSNSGFAGELMITLTVAMAKAERHRILERTHEGREAAKAKGIAFGPKRFVDGDKVVALKQAGMKVTDIMKETGYGRSTIYKVLKLQGKDIS